MERTTSEHGLLSESAGNPAMLSSADSSTSNLAHRPSPSPTLATMVDQGSSGGIIVSSISGQVASATAPPPPSSLPPPPPPPTQFGRGTQLVHLDPRSAATTTARGYHDLTVRSPMRALGRSGRNGHGPGPPPPPPPGHGRDDMMAAEERERIRMAMMARAVEEKTVEFIPGTKEKIVLRVVLSFSPIWHNWRLWERNPISVDKKVKAVMRAEWCPWDVQERESFTHVNCVRRNTPYESETDIKRDETI